MSASPAGLRFPSAINDGLVRFKKCLSYVCTRKFISSFIRTLVDFLSLSTEMSEAPDSSKSILFLDMRHLRTVQCEM